MPIKFRCPHCQQFLGISRSRAGAVTDCPMCGRSIRVPLLDGSVEPLPSPELNLEDQGLASALDKLASLVSEGSPSASAAAKAPPAAPPRSVITSAPEPVPLPEPIAISPAPAAAAVLPQPSEGAGAAASSRPTEQVLESLARLDSADVRTASVSPARAHSYWLAWIAAFGLAGVMFAAGYAVGRNSSTTGDPPPAAAAPQTKPVEEPPAAVPSEPALTGRLLYVDAQGESRPDVGARVLVLPEERAGTSKLPAEGFRAGAAEVDRQIALAAIHASGGDFAVADDDGQFAIELPQAGLYQLILLSRYQARPDGVAVDPAVDTFLTQYVDRPGPLIGDAAVHASQFRYRGSGTSARDHVFESR